MGAIYTSLSMYWRFSVAGQEEVARALLARSVLRQIQLDLRSVVYHAASEMTTSSTSSSSSSSSSDSTSSSSNSSSSGASSGAGTGGTGGTGGSGGTGSSGASSSSSTTDSSSTTTTEETTPPPPLGLFGTATELEIHVSKPSMKEMYAPLGESGGRTSDLLTVTYYLAGSLTAASAGQAAQSGLARMAGDQLLISQAEAQGNSAVLMGNTEIIAPEVVAISFAYYDGLSWYDTWDSDALAGLPLAVEIQIELTAPQAAKTWNSSAGPAAYRLVVALPGGEPAVATAAP